MIKDREVVGVDFPLRRLGVLKVNPLVAALAQPGTQPVQRNFERERVGTKMKMPAVKSETARRHLVAEIWVERSRRKALVRLVQATGFVSQSGKTPPRKSVLQITKRSRRREEAEFMKVRNHCPPRDLGGYAGLANATFDRLKAAPRLM